MQCCALVLATYRKQQIPQLWMEGTGEGCGFFCSPKLPYLSTMSQQFCRRLWALQFSPYVQVQLFFFHTLESGRSKQFIPLSDFNQVTFLIGLLKINLVNLPMSSRTREKMLTWYVIKLLPLREFFLKMISGVSHQNINGVTLCVAWSYYWVKRLL